MKTTQPTGGRHEGTRCVLGADECSDTDITFFAWMSFWVMGLRKSKLVGN